MFHLSLYPVFDSYLLVAVVAVVLAALMGFGPSREKTSRRQRLALLVLRAAVIALVLLAHAAADVGLYADQQTAGHAGRVDRRDAEHDGARCGGQEDAVGGDAGGGWPPPRRRSNGCRRSSSSRRTCSTRTFTSFRSITAGSGSPTGRRATRPPSVRPSTTSCAASRASGCWA